MTSAAIHSLPALLPQKVLLARIRAGYKRISHVAKATGLDWKTIEAYENEARAPANPTLKVLRELARAYGVPVAEFFESDPFAEHAEAQA